MITSTDITFQVRTAVEAAGLDSAADFDIDGIVCEVIDTHGLVDVETIEHDSFWAIVARHDTTA